MSNYYLLSELNPLTTLQLLAEFCERAGEHVFLLSEIEAYIDYNPIEPIITLRIKDPADAAHRQAAFGALSDLYRKLNLRGIAAFLTEDTGYMTLLETLPYLLEATIGAGDTGGHGLDPREKLLVGIDLAVDDSKVLFERLRMAATHTRISIARHTDHTFHLYHVLDDHQRFSTYLGAEAGEQFAHCHELICYKVPVEHENATFSVFLPPVVPNAEGEPTPLRPDKVALGYFCRIILSAPALFGIQVAERRSDVLFAIVVHDIKRYFLYTGGLQFLHESELGTVATFASYHFLNLTTSHNALRELRQSILAQDPNTGYRIDLRNSTYREYADAEYKRLQRQVAAYEDRMAELESFAVARPKLLRFTRHQLPALSDVIRSYRPQDLRKLYYAFQANHELPEDWMHFLYIQPAVEIPGLNPLVWRDADEHQRIEFWLDPNWARFYNRSPNNVLVFVPKGKMLHPPMHSWDIATMDEYLRDILGVKGLPPKPVYIFDVDPGDEQRLLISILDWEKFQALDTPSCIGWLNDNLITMRAFPEVEVLISALAGDIRRKETVDAVSVQAHAAEEQFRSRAEHTAQEIMSVTHELMRLMDEEFKHIITETQEFAEDAADLNYRLDIIKQHYDVMQERTEETEGLVEDTRSATRELYHEMRDIRAKVFRAVHSAHHIQEHLREQIAAEVEKILATQRDLEIKKAELEKSLSRRRSKNDKP